MPKRLCIETNTPRTRELQELTKAQRCDWYALIFFAAEQDVPGLLDSELMNRSRRTLPRLLGTNWHHFDKFVSLLVREKLADVEPDGALWLRFFDVEDESEDMTPRQRGRRGDPNSPAAIRARARRRMGEQIPEQISENDEQFPEQIPGNGFVPEKVGGLLVQTNGANNDLPSRARRNPTFRESNVDQRSSVRNVGERPNESEDFNFVVQSDSRRRPAASRKPSRPPDEYAGQVRALVEELRDMGSEKGLRQLLSVCDEHDLGDLPAAALDSTRRAEQKAQPKGLERPGAYFRKTLLQLLDKEGVVVTNKAERQAVAADLGLAAGATAEDRQAALRASLPPLPDEQSPHPVSEQRPNKSPLPSPVGRNNGFHSAKNAEKKAAAGMSEDERALLARVEENRQRVAASDRATAEEAARLGPGGMPGYD